MGGSTRRAAPKRSRSRASSAICCLCWRSLRCAAWQPQDIACDVCSSITRQAVSRSTRRCWRRQVRRHQACCCSVLKVLAKQLCFERPSRWQESRQRPRECQLARGILEMQRMSTAKIIHLSALLFLLLNRDLCCVSGRRHPPLGWSAACSCCQRVRVQTAVGKRERRTCCCAMPAVGEMCVQHSAGHLSTRVFLTVSASSHLCVSAGAPTVGGARARLAGACCRRHALRRRRSR